MWIHRLRRFFKARVVQSKVSPPLYGVLGDRSGRIPTGVVGEVYVTLFSGQVVRALNSSVPHQSVPVEVVRQSSGKYSVLRMIDLLDDLPYPESSIADTTPMTWPGVSTVWVRQEQILTGLVIPDGMNIRYYGSSGVIIDGRIHGISPRIFDMSENVPDDGALWVSVSIDSSEEFQYYSGELRESWEDLDLSDIVIPSVKEYFLFAVRLYSGQSSIRKTDNRYNDIFDPRFAGGGVSGSSSIEPLQRIMLGIP